MKTIINNDHAYIECPKCLNVESIHVDEQRHHLQSLSILSWDKDEEGKNEVSNMECNECKKQFPLEWDYSNEC